MSLEEPYRGRVEKLVAFVRRLSPENFDMSVVTLFDTFEPTSRKSLAQRLHTALKKTLQSPERSCGAVGCLWGWTPAIFPETFRWSPDCGLPFSRDESLDISRDFDVGGKQWYGISQQFFLPSSYRRAAVKPSHAEEKECVLLALTGVLAGTLAEGANSREIAAYIRDALPQVVNT